MCRTRITIMGYYTMYLVLGIVYPIHVCLQMYIYMLRFFVTISEKYYFSLLHPGQILSKSSPIAVASDAEVTKKVADQ